MKEIWKNIYGFEGLYQISNYGNVKSLKYEKERILKPRKNNDGYLQVDLCKDGKVKNMKIHRLVALHFIPNDDLLKNQINHKSEVKTDNRVENLEWCTQEYNINFSQSKQVNQFDLDKNYIKTWKSTKEIEKELGFSHGNISKCCNGKQKTSNGFIWKYA